jgi:hypothetical protein
MGGFEFTPFEKGLNTSSTTAWHLPYPSALDESVQWFLENYNSGARIGNP